ADRDELMDEAISGNKNAIVNLNVSGDERAVCNDDVIAELGIMTNVAMGHQEIIRTNNRILSDFCGAMDCDVLAKNVGFADAQTGWFIFVFQILWGFADHAPGVE